MCHPSLSSSKIARHSGYAKSYLPMNSPDVADTTSCASGIGRDDALTTDRNLSSSVLSVTPSHALRSSMSGRTTPTPARPLRATRVTNVSTSPRVNRPVRRPVSRQRATTPSRADAPRSTTVRTAEVTGIASTRTMSLVRMSLDSWTMNGTRFTRRCRGETTSIVRGRRSVIPQRYAAVRCEAAAGSVADTTAAMTCRCHVSPDPASP